MTIPEFWSEGFRRALAGRTLGLLRDKRERERESPSTHGSFFFNSKKRERD